MRFIVDTGATMISLGATDARRVGVDFNRGQKALTNTANGQAVVSKVSSTPSASAISRCITSMR